MLIAHQTPSTPNPIAANPIAIGMRRVLKVMLIIAGGIAAVIPKSIAPRRASFDVNQRLLGTNHHYRGLVPRRRAPGPPPWPPYRPSPECSNADAHPAAVGESLIGAERGDNHETTRNRQYSCCFHRILQCSPFTLVDHGAWQQRKIATDCKRHVTPTVATHTDCKAGQRSRWLPRPSTEAASGMHPMLRAVSSSWPLRAIRHGSSDGQC